MALLVENETFVKLFPESLWGKGPSKRSQELTPLYVDRYRGPHTSSKETKHTYWELVVILRGCGQLLSQGECLTLVPGVALLIPPGRWHREQSTEPMEVIWAGLSGTRLEAMSRTNISQVTSRQLVAQAEQLWVQAQQRHDPVGGELDGLAAALLARCLYLIHAESIAGADLIDQVLAYLHAHLTDCPPIARLASRFGFSEGYFFRAFKRRTGCTPHVYLARLRLEQAALLLRQSSLSVARVARLVGYADPLYFSRAFSRHFGKPPAQWR
jgi:AraC-like DNA-binding protein